MDLAYAEGGKIQVLVYDSLADLSELMGIHNAFHQAHYQQVIDFDTSSLAAEHALPARIFQLRAQIASGQAEEALADVEGEDDVPDLAAVKALAQYHTGDTKAAVKAIEQLASSVAAADNITVQVLGGTILQAAGKTEEALALLSKHSGSLEACDSRLARERRSHMLSSVQGGGDGPDTPTTKSNGPCAQGSAGGKEMGPR